MNLLYQYRDVFVDTDGKLGRTGVVKHTIDTGDAKPVKQNPRRIPIHLKHEVENVMQDMIDKNLIEPSTSPWASPVVLVKKDGSLRFCIDYRRVNDLTINTCAYPLPRIDSTLEHLSGSKWFSTCDLASGFHQVEMAENDKAKTAFTTPTHGLYQFNVMPFGLTGAPSTFERLMEQVLSGLQFKTLLIYIDDVIIYSKSVEEGLTRLETVFQRFRSSNLKLKAKKCLFFQREVTYLGHKVSDKGIETDPSKLSAVKDWPQPKTVGEVSSFVGFCSYYRKFIQDFAKIANPLHKLTEKKQKVFNWTEECTLAFQKLKEHLISAPILAYPNAPDEFILDTDASDFSIGAVLSQIQDGHEKVIAYASKSLTKPERNYCVTRRELLAVVFFVKHFKHYLYGKRFRLRTDHASLKWLFRFKEPEGQIARWLEMLGSYQFDIQHRAGKLHSNADALSRLPCRQCGRIDQVEVQAVTRSQAKHEKIDEDFYETDKNTTENQNEQTSDEPWLQIWNTETILKNQEDDAIIGQMLRLKNGAQAKPNWNEVSKYSPQLKAYWFLWDQLHVRNQILYRRWETKQVVWQLVLPFVMRKQILQELHASPTGGHLGEHKILAKVRQRYFWHDMKNDVKLFCQQCTNCAQKKPPAKKNKAPLGQYLIGAPLERVALDIVGPFPRSDSGNKYVLVLGDYFTKWMEAYPLRNIEAQTVAETFVHEFVSRFGVPQELHTDQGTQFQSRVMNEICKILGIHKTRTTPFHPMSDGLVERFNRILESMLSLCVKTNQRDWDKFVPLVTMAYRSTPQESTQVSPNMLLFGHEINLPVDLMVGCPNESETLSEHDYVSDLRERLEIAHDYARRHLQSSANRQKKYYDIKMSGEPYQTGDFVWLYTPVKKVGVSPKLQKFWDGPYLVLERLSDAVYRIQQSEKSIPKVVHFDRIKKYLGPKVADWLAGKEQTQPNTLNDH